MRLAPHAVILAALLICADTTRLAITERGCIQNEGRPCTQTELEAQQQQSNGQSLLSARHGVPARPNAGIRDYGFSISANGHPVLLNPGVIVYNGVLWGVGRIKLSRDFTWSKCPANSLYAEQPCPYADFLYVSFNGIFTLSPALAMSSDFVALNHDLDYFSVNRFDEQYLGAEDPRVFAWGSEAYIAYNAPPPTRRWHAPRMRQMYIQRILPRIGTATPLSHRRLDRVEKNWAPISPAWQPSTSAPVAADEFLFARFIEPHEIVSCTRYGECRSVATSSQQRAFDGLVKKYGFESVHLGTNAIRVTDTLYGAILHAVNGTDTKYKSYKNIAYLFSAEPPYGIEHVASDPVALPAEKAFEHRHRMVFTCGLAYVEGHVVISYTVNDQTPLYITTTLGELFRNMVPIDEYE